MAYKNSSRELLRDKCLEFNCVCVDQDCVDLSSTIWTLSRHVEPCGYRHTFFSVLPSSSTTTTLNDMYALLGGSFNPLARSVR